MSCFSTRCSRSCWWNSWRTVTNSISPVEPRLTAVSARALVRVAAAPSSSRWCTHSRPRRSSGGGPGSAVGTSRHAGARRNPAPAARASPGSTASARRPAAARRRRRPDRAHQGTAGSAATGSAGSVSVSVHGCGRQSATQAARPWWTASSSTSRGSRCHIGRTNVEPVCSPPLLVSTLVAWRRARRN